MNIPTTPSELLEKIRLGEDSFLELKEVRFAGNRVSGPSRDSLADELAAFANSRGGLLVLGVDDKSREVLGLPLDKLDAVETFAREICNALIQPPLIPVLERLTLPDQTGEEQPILKIEVPPGLFVHKSPGGYFHRVGSSKRDMSPEYLARLMQQRSQAGIIRFDEQCVPGANLEDLEKSLWQRFATERTQDTREDFLQKHALARPDESRIFRPTVAGVLMASKDPRRFLPNAYIQAVAYRGKDISPAGEADYQRDAQDISGPLDAQIFSACDFVRKNMFMRARKREGREDLPQYDMVSVFEAIANAVAHRDYAIHGSKVRLRLFEDRLELYSPGMLANTMTVESLSHRQSVRNEAITSLLARCLVSDNDREVIQHRTHVMDKRGEGVPVILSRSLELSEKKPKYELLDNTELKLTIYAASSDHENHG